MNKFLITFLFLLCVKTIQSQEFIGFNHGGIKEKSYYSVIPYNNVRGLIIVEPEINGKKYKFMVDTGAPAALSQNTFEELNIPKTCRVNMEDSSAKTDSVITTIIPNIKLVDLNFTDVPAVVLPANIIFDCLNIDGIIGSNMLRNSIIRFSSKESSLTITNSTKELNLKKKESTRIELMKEKFASSHPLIRIDVENKKLKGREQLEFDSGMTGLYQISLNHFKVFNEHKIFKDIHQSRGGDNIGFCGNENDTLSYFARIPKMQICKTELKNISLTTTPGIERVGAGLFNYGIVTVDFINKRFYFESYKESFNLFHKEYPIEIKVEDGKLLVATVWNENLKKQIKEGDQIVKVDSVDYEYVEACQILNNFNITDHNVLTIKSTDGCEKVIIIKDDMKI